MWFLVQRRTISLLVLLLFDIFSETRAWDGLCCPTPLLVPGRLWSSAGAGRRHPSDEEDGEGRARLASQAELQPGGGGVVLLA